MVLRNPAFGGYGNICDDLGISLQKFFTSELLGQEKKVNGYKD